MSLFLKEISSKHREMSAFIRFPDKLYKGCRYYVPALHRNQFSTLSKERNPAFGHCEARYWLAYSGKEVVGRVAGIINHRYNQERAKKYMRFGWLDFIEDEKVLHTLLQAVEKWAFEKGMQYIHGPLGFTSFDASGVLVEGFDEWPTSFGRYNYPYYDRMLKIAGYVKDVDWVERNIKVPEQKPQRALKIAEFVKKRYSLRNAPLRSRKDVLRYAGKAFELINNVYSDLYGFSTLTPAQIEALTNEYLSMISPDFVAIILNDQDEVVAFGLVMNSLTKALKKAKGQLFPFGLLYIVRALYCNDTIDMLLIGVKPEYQNKGAQALVFEKIINTIYQKGIKHVESTRELESNQKVQQLWSGYNSRQHKRSRCYIKIL